MNTLKIVDGDLSITKGSLDMVDGQQEIKQSIERILSTNKGEWFLDESFGLDYSNLQVKNFDEELIRLDFIEALSQDPRFEELLEFTIDYDSKKRAANINFKARIDGVEVKEVLNLGT